MTPFGSPVLPLLKMIVARWSIVSGCAVRRPIPGVEPGPTGREPQPSFCPPPTVAATSSSQRIVGPSGRSNLAFSTNLRLVTMVRRRLPDRRFQAVLADGVVEIHAGFAAEWRGHVRAPATVGGSRRPTCALSLPVGLERTGQGNRADQSLKAGHVRPRLVGHHKAERMPAHGFDKRPVQGAAI